MNERLARVWLRWLSNSEYQLPFVSDLRETGKRMGIALSDEDFKEDFIEIKVWDDVLLVPKFDEIEKVKAKIDTLISILSEAHTKEYNLIREVTWKLLPQQAIDQYGKLIIEALKYVEIIEIRIGEYYADIKFDGGFIFLSKEAIKKLICK